MLTHRGFTLVELLVVMVIVGTAMSIVGPLSYKQHEKAQVNSEWVRITTSLEGIRKQAFLSGRNLTVVLDGKQLNVSGADQVHYSLETEFIFFASQQLQVSRQGFVTPGTLNGHHQHIQFSHTFSNWAD